MAATITYLQLTKDATDLSTYTFSSVNFSTASTDRRIIVAISGRTQDGTSSGNVISSVTIGGVSATIAVQAQNSGNVQGIAIALVPTGTSGDVVVVFSETMTNADIATYRTTGIGSNVATSIGTSTANPLTANINVVAGGVALALAKSDDGATTATWAGLTERYDEGDANTNDISGASDAFATTQTGLTVSCTWVSSVRPVYVVASFAPTGVISFGNTSDNGSQGTTSWAHNNNGDLLLVGIHETANSVSGVTYNGVSMTQVGTTLTFAGAGRYLSLWRLINPAVGSNNIAITGGANHQAAAISMGGVDSTTPTSGFNSGTTASSPMAVSVTTTVNNAYVVGFGLYITKSTLGTGVSDTKVISYDTNGALVQSTSAVTPAGVFSLSVAMTGSAIAGVVATGVNPTVTTTRRVFMIS